MTAVGRRRFSISWAHNKQCWWQGFWRWQDGTTPPLGARVILVSARIK